MLLTKQRSLILNIVKNMDGHLSADEIYILARNSMPGIALATVYNNLNALYAAGEIGKVKIPDSADLYDRSPILHDHIICSKCKGVKDVRIPDFLGQLKESIGEEIDSYDLTINYTCQKCRKTSC
ncbi:MAG: transcriptional repressor [Clostridia bacterium]|nr:transcriptional repressor [Clostridia bacterium]